MKTINMREAILEALNEEMTRDETTVFFGEDVADFGGTYKTSRGLKDLFGDRVFDTPIAEPTIVGAAVGMALAGLRPIPEICFADFMSVAFDEIYNKMGKWRWMHGGMFDMPITLRMAVGIAGGAGPEHSQSPQAHFMHAQGLYVVIPSTPYDAKGLLKTAIRDDNPVLFFEHKLLYDRKGQVPQGEYTIPFGKADVKKEGKDVTIIATALQVHTALEAAEKLSKKGYEVEVIDPRTLVPLDKETILKSVKKTGRLIIVHEEPKRGGTGAELTAMVVEEALFHLKAPVKRVASPDVPIAQNIALEKYYRPSVEQIINAVDEVMEY